MKNIIVAGADPGLVNFGFSIVQYKNGKYKVLHASMIKNRITDLKSNIIGQQTALYKEVRKYLIKFKPKKLVIERFMVRARFGQSIAECVSVMLGTLAVLCRKLKIEFMAITAPSWKNSFHRALKKDLKGLYKFLKPLPPHITDSVLQATYGINSKFDNFSVGYLKALRDQWPQ